MSPDDSPDNSADEFSDQGVEIDVEVEAGASDGDAPGPAEKTRERLEAEADRAVTEFDESVVDLLAWVLDTETRARIYVFLRQHPGSTSDEVADGTGLYPSTVREALAELHEDGVVTRGKRASAGAGNNPYEYEAIAPSDLVRDAVGQIQSQLNAVFNLDDRLDRGDDATEAGGPVTITVEDEADDADREES